VNGHNLTVARILAGVSGGIAAYKACELVRLLVKDGHDVVPLLTPGARRFVSEETFRALARRPPADDVYVHLTRADLLVVAPCTANTLAKLAHGIADNVLAEAALAHRGATLVAPAMNPRMWAHAATQANVGTLVERGVELVGPDEGETAEGEWGVGRMAEPDEILLHIRTLLGPTSTVLQGKRVLVTAGGTREPLDSVRFVGNRSSGRMGVALAAEARRRGARVTLVGANLQVPPPFGVELVPVATAEDVERETLARADADVILMAAAVADYRPAAARGDKRPKDRAGWTVEFEPTTDVLAELGRNRHDGQVIVGFAADHGETGLARAREKLERKGANLFVFNDVSRSDIGFDARDNEVVLVTAAAERRVDKARKEEIARVVLDEVEELFSATAERGAAMAATAEEKIDRSTAKPEA
jgi:phosphopantothenoylcysteine decarboxylase/phosphopantothenate--cysteine ligase